MKFKRSHRSDRKFQLGQAMVETVIVLPMFIFFILGMIQMTMMHQARLMLEYAAFNAARTGSVWNADPEKMRQAALLSLIASRPSWPGIGGVGKIEDYGDLVVAAGVLMLGKTISDVGEDSGVSSGLLSLVKVDTLSPTQADLEADQQEIDFDQGGDDFAVRRLGQLTIRVTYFYSLNIPFANWVIWNSWYLARSLKMGNVMSDFALAERLGVASRLGSKPFIAFDAIKFSSVAKLIAEGLAGGKMKTSPYECFRSEDWMAMIALPELLGDRSNSYFIPMVTAHTIRMQSNHYKDNLPSAAEASCEE